MASKCVCHINGYELKDAKSRKDIEELKTRATALEGKTAEVENQKTDISELKTKTTALENSIGKVDNLEAQVNTFDQRIDVLEQGGGNGGSGGNVGYVTGLDYNNKTVITGLVFNGVELPIIDNSPNCERSIELLSSQMTMRPEISKVGEMIAEANARVMSDINEVIIQANEQLTAMDERVTTLENDTSVSELSERVTTLENNSDGKMYLHQIVLNDNMGSKIAFHVPSSKTLAGDPTSLSILVALLKQITGNNFNKRIPIVGGYYEELEEIREEIDLLYFNQTANELSGALMTLVFTVRFGAGTDKLTFDITNDYSFEYYKSEL